MNVRRASAVWGDTPSGLGYSDMAVCHLISADLERRAHRNGAAPYSVLDLGTYFGHSAFSVVYGAAASQKNPVIRVLSIDIFAQPKWLVENNPQVKKFIEQYGSTGPEAIARRLDQACSQIGVANNPIQLLQRDVLTMTAQDVLAFAPSGYQLIMVDCAKTPELMNRITTFLTDSRVCPIGTIALFQDLFDWHAPWNVYALWLLLRAGAVSLYRGGKDATPFAEKVADRDIGIVCDQIKEPLLAGETWSTPFTALNNEVAALDYFIQMFRDLRYVNSALKLECLKIGAFLRASRLDEAETMIARLDATWPAEFPDYALQDAYRRLRHLRTGYKDLSLVFKTEHGRSRNTGLAKRLRNISSRLAYLNPIRTEPISLPK
jgi:hypothetical protein